MDIVADDEDEEDEDEDDKEDKDTCNRWDSDMDSPNLESNNSDMDPENGKWLSDDDGNIYI